MDTIKELQELRKEVVHALQAHNIANAFRHDAKIEAIIKHLAKQAEEAGKTSS